MPCPSRESLSASYLSQLSLLSEELPSRFRPTLDYLTSRLPSLFADDWPLVPNHTDLLENNIHVDPETGKLMGIYDWKGAEAGPFGTSLGGLETMLGFWSLKTGWSQHANQQDLRAVFWFPLVRDMMTCISSMWLFLAMSVLRASSVANSTFLRNS